LLKCYAKVAVPLFSQDTNQEKYLCIPEKGEIVGEESTGWGSHPVEKN